MTSDDKSEVSEAREGLADAALGSLVELLRLQSEPAASRSAVEIARRFSPLIRRFWRLNRCGDYEDFSQEVLTRLFVALPHLRTAAAFPGLFRQIVVGAAADYWRRHQPAGVDVPDEELKELPDPDADFTEALVTRLLVGSYLELLPSREREVLQLLYFADLDTSEAARILGITPGALRTTKVRALARLREAIRNM